VLRKCADADQPITLQKMKNNKEAWRKVTRTVQEIDTCVDNTARAAYHRGEGADLPVVVGAALGATKECVSSIGLRCTADAP